MTSWYDGAVTVKVETAATVVRTVKVGRRPRSVAFLPDGSRAYVTNENDGSLRVSSTKRRGY